MRNRENVSNIRKLLSPLLLIVVLMALSTTMIASADDWPMYRNDAGNTGKSSETINLPLTEQWHSNAPEVEENGAVVSKGIVYMSTEDGKLYAFQVSTGSVVSGYPITTGANMGSPAVDAVNNKVYVIASSMLLAYNLNGTSAWSKSVGSVGDNYNKGPIIEGGYVYLKAGNKLYKYDSSGNLQWSSISTGISTQPSIMGNFVYTNTETGQIRKYEKATGTEVITGGFPISTSSSQSVVTTVNGKIFLKADILYAYSAADGSLLWSQPDGGNSIYYNSPSVSNGVVYTYGWDGKVYAFDEITGVSKSGFPSVTLNTADDRNYGSPAVVNDKIFIGAGTSQKLKVLGAAGTANAGNVLAEYRTFSADTQGFDLCSPIISDGVVFMMLDGGGLYAFFSGGGTVWSGGAITINVNSGCTESRDVSLNLDRGSNIIVNQMRISEDPLFAGAVWEPYSATKTWQLSSGYGIKTVYVQFKDSNEQISNVFNDIIEYSSSCNGASTGTIVSIADATTTQNNNVNRPIMIQNVNNFAAATILFTYDTNVVNVLGVSPGDLGGVISSIDNTLGKVTMSAFSTTAKSGNVTFANLQLKAIGAINATSPLTLTVSSLSDQNGDSIPYTIKNGIFTISSVIKGDVNGDGLVTIVDALFIAQYTVGSRTLTSTQLAAGDVNGDGLVTIVDALFIAQYTVGSRQL